MAPRVLGIVGPGLIGTSVALAARRAWPGAEVRLLDRADSLDPAATADAVVVATPVDEIPGVLRALAPRLRADTLVVDTGSTKRTVLAAAQAAGLPRFVGGHPMAGGAGEGAGLARAELFDRRPWFLMGGPEEARAAAAAFVGALGAVAVALDDGGERHDRVMAALSHLPQIAASALMVVAARAVSGDELAWAGPGLRDTTRLASSPARVWRGVLAENADHVAPLLEALAAELHHLAGALDDEREVARLFDAAVRAKAACL